MAGHFRLVRRGFLAGGAAFIGALGVGYGGVPPSRIPSLRDFLPIYDARLQGERVALYREAFPELREDEIPMRSPGGVLLPNTRDPEAFYRRMKLFEADG